MNGTMSVSPERLPAQKISPLLLERYNLGELTPQERRLVETELLRDDTLKIRYEALKDSDAELRRLYPWDSFKNSLKIETEQNYKKAQTQNARRNSSRSVWGRLKSSALLRGACAAALLLCVLLPSLHYLRGRAPAEETAAGFLPAGSDRAKGAEIKPELSIYLLENGAEEEHKLSDSTPLREGNTVQLAYMTPPGAEYYGVIFSIDGRSQLTLHYPYRREQTPLLESGKRTFLSEAYTLDDAPELEIFFMVMSGEKLETETVLRSAHELAREPHRAVEKSAALFGGCEVEAITIKKEQ